MVGCQSEAGYRVLTFFFEGVPPPGSIKITDRIKKTVQRVPPTPEEIADKKMAARLAKQKHGGKHKPARDCNNCHRGSLGSGRRDIKKPIPDLCYSCHTDYHSSGDNLHGPVAVGECLFCHDSHASRYTKLQTAPQPNLCYMCHTQEDVALTDIHKDVLNSICTDCHDPHTGSLTEFAISSIELKSDPNDIELDDPNDIKLDDPNDIELDEEFLEYSD
jgi:predicted CXXCH cytochrome family protein